MALIDITCPKCGSSDHVKVAPGTRDFPLSPEKWFCRCYACNKSFNPRKGVKIMAFETYSPEKAKKPGLTASTSAQSTPMTVAKAMEYREKTQKEVACISLVIEELSVRGERYLELTPGVESLLNGYRKECAETLDRINKTFETTEIVI